MIAIMNFKRFKHITIIIYTSKKTRQNKSFAQTERTPSTNMMIDVSDGASIYTPVQYNRPLFLSSK